MLLIKLISILIRKAKYCLLFAVGQGNTESLNGALSFMINHI